MPPDYRLIAITAPELHPDLPLEEAGRAAEAGGATALQVRLKGAPASELLRTTELLLRAVDIPVYVNDRLDVAWAAGAHGVHLGADDLPPDRVSAVAPDSLLVGLSVGSEVEAVAARRATNAHYWSLGPYQTTATKSDAGAPLGDAGIRELARLAPPGIPVIAIGGIRASDVPAVLEAGVQGVAVISEIFAAPDVEQATSSIRRALDTSLG